jgi:VCBS repeat-containing protein
MTARRRTITVQANVLGVTLGGFDLYVYRFNESIQQYEQYRVQPNWVTALLGGSSPAYTITLPGGDYLFLLNASGGLTLLTSYTLNIQADHTYAVDSLSAATNGNLLANDSAPANTVITEVNGVTVNTTGTTTINGQYGTLTIDAKGNYTYTLRSGLGADGINTPDSFVYKVKAPNGDTGSASLNITATPQALDAVNDISSQMAVTTRPIHPDRLPTTALATPAGAPNSFHPPHKMVLASLKSRRERRCKTPYCILTSLQV